tara:strand:+ start:790 stop:1044 length:255 start_codon:yes stop_codon:yes gene_type:complete
MAKIQISLKEIEKILRKIVKNKNINLNKLDLSEFLDSLQMLNLIVELEKKFKLKIKDRYIESKNFENINKIKQVLEINEKSKKK